MGSILSEIQSVHRMETHKTTGQVTDFLSKLKVFMVLQFWGLCSLWKLQTQLSPTIGESGPANLAAIEELWLLVLGDSYHVLLLTALGEAGEWLLETTFFKIENSCLYTTGWGWGRGGVGRWGWDGVSSELKYLIRAPHPCPWCSWASLLIYPFQNSTHFWFLFHHCHLPPAAKLSISCCWELHSFLLICQFGVRLEGPLARKVLNHLSSLPASRFSSMCYDSQRWQFIFVKHNLRHSHRLSKLL